VTKKTRKPLKVFCSYSHQDEHYLDVLKTWLVGLEREGLIEQWHDRMIRAGGEWEEAIAEHLETSDMVLLLVTPDFIASQYIYEKEISRAVERHGQGRARVIPIIVRPSPPLSSTPFRKLQALPKDAKPVTTWLNQDEAWLDVLKGIQQAVEELLFEPQSPGPEQSSEQIYREAVEWAWADEELHGREVERLSDLVSHYGLDISTASVIEHEIMGDTKEAIFERQTAEKEQGTFRQYREAVQLAWADEELDRREAETLRDLAGNLRLSPSNTAKIEREVMGASKEEIQERQYHAAEERAKERYREMVAGAWSNKILSKEEAHRLSALASELGLSTDITDAIEREVTGDTVEVVLERREQASRERYRQKRARPPTVEVPAPTVAIPDVSAQEISQARNVLDLKGLKLVVRTEAASDTIPEGQIIGQSPEAGRDVQAGSLVNVTVSSGPTTVDVPNLDGRSHSEARSTLEAAGLELGSMTFAPSDDIPVDRVVRQSPGPGEKVTRGSSVRVTLSSGPQTVIEQSPPGPSLIDSFARICAKYTGSSYYLEEAITGEKLANARSSFPIPSTERVVALLDVTEDGSSKYGLAICEEGIRWCNERTSSGGLIYRRWRSTQRGTLQWSEFSDAYIEKHSGHNAIPIEIGENNIFFMTRIAMDPDDLVQLLSELQTFLKAYSQQGFYHSGDAKEKIEELGVDNTIMASNADQINRLYTLGHTYAVNAVAFSPDSKLLASGSAHAAVGLWRVEDSELLHGLVWHAGSVNTVAFSPDGKQLASGSEDRTVRLWRVEDGAHLGVLEEHKNRVNAVAFSPDGKLLASGSGGRIRNDDTVRLWRVEDGELVHTLEGHPTSINTVAFSADGNLLASVSIDGTVRVWRVDDETLIGELRLHQARSLLSSAFSPDGKLLASGSEDRTVRLWRVEGGAHLRELEEHTSKVNSVAFSADGKLLASGSDDKTVRLWGIT
jgi:WD40 repeat protein